MEIHFKLNNANVVLRPGDVLDLGENGVLEWFSGKRADANRLDREARQEQVREVIAFTEKRVRGEKR